MIIDREFHTLWGKALDAVEGKAAAEQQTREAQQAAGRARTEAEQAKAEAAKIKAEARAFSQRRMVEQDTIDANLKLARDAEKRQHEASLANTQRHEVEASGRFEALQSKITEAQQQLAEIEAQLAKHRAKIADLAKL